MTSLASRSIGARLFVSPLCESYQEIEHSTRIAPTDASYDGYNKVYTQRDSLLKMKNVLFCEENILPQYNTRASLPERTTTFSSRSLFGAIEQSPA